MKILIIGGYGAFGGRLARLLADNESLSVFIGGRTLSKAERLCTELNKGGAKFTPAAVDKYNLTPALSRYSPDIVVDASGPFNLKQDDPFVVVNACLAAGAHYLDLADGADFVMEVSKFDDEAKAKSLCVISGLSTCPALTGAVFREAEKNGDVDRVEIGVAPSPYARMGLSVVKGIFDYAGEKITKREGGKFVTETALANARRQTIAPPGELPLRSRLFAFVDCPDLQITNVRDNWVGAGTKPEILLRLLMIMSKLRAALKLPSYAPLAKPGHWLMNKFSRGEHRGGLYMKVSETKSWHILAEGDDGPFIPSMAAAALISKWAAEQRPAPGARPAHETLDLVDFDPFIENRDISHGWREELHTKLEFEKNLSHKFNELPELVRELHAPDGPEIWTGTARIDGPDNFLGRLAGMIAGLNVKSATTDVTVSITPTPKGEVWERNFGGQKFKSRLIAGTGKTQHLMMEHFGALSFAMALVMKDDRLYFVPRQWFFLGIPMPRFLLPGGETYETVKDGKFEFHVDLRVPIIGRVAEYHGRLERKT